MNVTKTKPRVKSEDELALEELELMEREAKAEAFVRSNAALYANIVYNVVAQLSNSNVIQILRGHTAWDNVFNKTSKYATVSEYIRVEDKGHPEFGPYSKISPQLIDQIARQPREKILGSYK